MSRAVIKYEVLPNIMKVTWEIYEPKIPIQLFIVSPNPVLKKLGSDGS